MIEKDEIITLENGHDYVISEVIMENDINYYLLFRLDGEEVTEDVLIVNENDENSLELLNEEEFEDIKKKFIERLLKNWYIYQFFSLIII